MTMNRAPSAARKTNVLMVFLLISNEPNALPWPKVPSLASVEVPGVNVDARHILPPEHVGVASVVLEGEEQLESEVPQLPDRPLLELPGRRIVAVIAHDEQIPPQFVVLEPRQGLGLDPDRPGGEQHDVEFVVEELE